VNLSVSVLKASHIVSQGLGPVCGNVELCKAGKNMALKDLQGLCEQLGERRGFRWLTLRGEDPMDWPHMTPFLSWYAGEFGAPFALGIDTTLPRVVKRNSQWQECFKTVGVRMVTTPVAPQLARLRVLKHPMVVLKTAFMPINLPQLRSHVEAIAYEFKNHGGSFKGMRLLPDTLCVQTPSFWKQWRELVNAAQFALQESNSVFPIDWGDSHRLMYEMMGAKDDTALETRCWAGRYGFELKHDLAWHACSRVPSYVGVFKADDPGSVSSLHAAAVPVTKYAQPVCRLACDDEHLACNSAAEMDLNEPGLSLG